MTPNIGTVDRLIRIALGLVIIGVGAYYRSWWALAGLVPIVTAGLRFCPAYLPFGLSTCRREKNL